MACGGGGAKCYVPSPPEPFPAWRAASEASLSNHDRLWCREGGAASHARQRQCLAPPPRPEHHCPVISMQGWLQPQGALGKGSSPPERHRRPFPCGRECWWHFPCRERVVRLASGRLGWVDVVGLSSEFTLGPWAKPQLHTGGGGRDYIQFPYRQGWHNPLPPSPGSLRTAVAPRGGGLPGAAQILPGRKPVESMEMSMPPPPVASCFWHSGAGCSCAQGCYFLLVRSCRCDPHAILCKLGVLWAACPRPPPLRAPPPLPTCSERSGLTSTAHLRSFPAFLRTLASAQAAFLPSAWPSFPVSCLGPSGAKSAGLDLFPLLPCPCLSPTEDAGAGSALHLPTPSPARSSLWGSPGGWLQQAGPAGRKLWRP